MLACLLLLSLPSSASPADSCRHQQTARAGNQQGVKWQASIACLLLQLCRFVGVLCTTLAVLLLSWPSCIIS
jgi:hypothetical protein